MWSISSPASGAGVMGVIDDKGAGLAGQAADQGVDGAEGVVTGPAPAAARRGVREPGVRDGGPQPGGQQGRGHALVLELDVDAHGPPPVDQLGTEDRLAVAAGGFDHDDLVVGATIGEAGPGDVVRGKAAHLGALSLFVESVPMAPGGGRRPWALTRV